MITNYTIEFRVDHIYVFHAEEFELSRELTDFMWSEIARACEKYHCYKVLIEAPAPNRDLDTAGAFESGARLSEIAPRLSVAICFHGYKTDDLTEFFETVARNRGVNVGFFDDAAAALTWLRSTAG
jgi:hypothetical protein